MNDKRMHGNQTPGANSINENNPSRVQIMKEACLSELLT